MNNFMDEFFRRKEDGFVFDSYSFLHLILFAFMVIVAILLYKYRRKIKENKKIYKYVRFIFIFLLAFQQISFLYFICFVRKDTINEALPLYTCRISIYSGFFALILNSNNLKILTIFWGLIGGNNWLNFSGFNAIFMASYYVCKFLFDTFFSILGFAIFPNSRQN